MTMQNNDGFDADALIREILGGDSTPTPTKRPWEGYAESDLRQHWRAGHLTEAEWQAELEARGKTAQQARDIMAYQKTVGVDAKGQLTSSEQRAITALAESRAAAAPKPDIDSWENPTLAAQGRSSITGEPFAGGTAGTGAVAAPTPTSSSSARTSTGSSGGSGGSTATSAPAAPPPPLRNSAADLANRGAVKVGSTPVLEGQQYRRVNEVVQDTDGRWYVVDPQGNVISGPYPNQTQANTANVYSELGPAITSNKYAAIGQAALDGPLRRRVSQGSGQNASLNLDDIIGLTHQSGDQAGEYMGSTSAFGSPVDVLRGNAGLPDYGGMYEVPGGGFTGRMFGDDGQEMAIGMSGPSQSGTHYGSHAQMMLAPYLSQSQIDRINPDKYSEIALRLGTLRDQGLLQDGAAMTPTSKGGKSADSAAQAANYSLLTGDPWEIDTLPMPMAGGGEVNLSPDWTAFMEQEALMNGAPWDPMGWLRSLGLPTSGNIRYNPYANLDASQVQDRRPSAYASGGTATVAEPSVIRGLQSGRNYGVLGAAPERVSGLGTNRLSIRPLGNQQQQQAANRYEQLIASRLGPNTPSALQMAQRQRELAEPRVTYQPAPLAWADQGAQIIDGLLQMPNGSFGTPIWNDDGSFKTWAMRRQNDVDIRPMNGIPDWMDRQRAQRGGRPGRGQMGNETYTSQSGPTPNIYAMGGDVVFQPSMPASSRPSYLRALSAGIRRQMKVPMPAVAV